MGMWNSGKWWMFDYRILQWFRLEGTLQITGRVAIHQIRLPKAPFNLTLNQLHHSVDVIGTLGGSTLDPTVCVTMNA